MRLLYYMLDFQKFTVYQKFLELNKLLVPVLKNRSIPIYLINQLDRSLTSISFNLAEGSGKFSRKDKSNFYKIARGSANEVAATLELLMIRGYINDLAYQKQAELMEEIIKMLSGLVRTMDERKPPN